MNYTATRTSHIANQPSNQTKETMTLEATLTRIDETLAALLVIAQTNAAAATTFGAVANAVSAVAEASVPVTKPAKTKAVKEEPAPAVAAPASTSTSPLGLVEGDPVGTRYWLVEAYNTVYAEHPGMPGCTISGAVITTAAEYLSKKAEFAKKYVLQPAMAAPSGQPVAESTPVVTASNTSLPDSTVSFKQVVDSAMALTKDLREGRGRGALVDILAKYLPDTPVADRKVGKLEAVGKNAEILATLSALLANDPAPVAGVEAEEDIFA